MISDPTGVCRGYNFAGTNCTCNVIKFTRATWTFILVSLVELHGFIFFSFENITTFIFLYFEWHTWRGTKISSLRWNAAPVSAWWTSSIAHCKPWQMATKRCCAASQLDYLLWTRAPEPALVVRYLPRRCNFRNDDQTHEAPPANFRALPSPCWHWPLDRCRSWSSGSYDTRIGRKAFLLTFLRDSEAAGCYLASRTSPRDQLSLLWPLQMVERDVSDVSSLPFYPILFTRVQGGYEH